MRTIYYKQVQTDEIAKAWGVPPAFLRSTNGHNSFVQCNKEGINKPLNPKTTCWTGEDLLERVLKGKSIKIFWYKDQKKQKDLLNKKTIE